MTRAARAALAAAALGACAGVPPAERSQATYDRALADGYGALADKENALADFRDARRFRAKQRAAEAGAPPPPDDLAGRDLDPADRDALAAARGRLLGAADEIARLTAPEQAARAQTAFDCWAEEAEERLLQPALFECRAAFDAATEALGEGGGDLVVLLPGDGPSAVAVQAGGASVLLDAPFAGAVGGVGRVDPATLDAAAVSRALATAETAEPDPFAAYTLTFETGGAVLTPEGETGLGEILAEAATRDAVRVTVFGHTDRVGGQASNVRLSRRRAEVIAARLVEGGLPASAVASDSFGESRPLVPTPDGVAEPRNRRVEVIVR